MEYKTGKLLEEIKSDLCDLTGRYSYKDEDKLKDTEYVRGELDKIIRDIEKHLED